MYALTIGQFSGLRPSDLIAASIPPGRSWTEILRTAWEAGAALLPIDHRLPAAEARRLVEAVRPTAVIDPGGTLTRLPDGVPADPDLALVVVTSGTGGIPRAVELSHAAVRAAVDAAAARLGSGSEDPWLCCLPIAHIAGMLVLVRALLLAAKVTVQPRFDVAMFESARDARFTAVVPTMLTRLLDARADLARFRAILVGGAALTPSPTRRARAAGARPVVTYGLTESCGGVVYDGIPLPGTEIGIGDHDEILLRSPTVMRGYRHDPDATAAAFTADGWLRTGDGGCVTDGRLQVWGRLEDVIITGGEKVWPDEVEGAIRAHPGVADAAVWARPDPEWGERVVAYVVPKSFAAPPTLPDIRAFLADRLAGFKAPREMILAESLPRSTSGKLRRQGLLSSGGGGSRRGPS